MGALIAALAKFGFPILANAVMSKGKDVVEEKLGVNLDQMLGTEEGRIELKKLEYSNEESLRQFTIASREQELRSNQMYLQDTDSARKMQVAALGQDDVFSKRFIYYFAIFWSVVSCTYIGAITFGTIPTANTRFADTILGFILGTLVATIIQFFFGSSKGSKDKDTANLLTALKGFTK